MKPILILEDSPTQAQKLKTILEAEGFEVRTARDGQEGLDIVGREDFDLVISDIVMPGVSGYDFCRRLKANPAKKDIPVILLTTLNSPMDIIKGLECGADNFVTKPYEPAHLVHRVRTVLQNRQMHLEGKLKLGVEIFFLGNKFTISSDKEQILDLLISTFEDMVQTNQQLQASQAELNVAKAKLERYARELEGRVRTSQEQFQRLADNAPDVIYRYRLAEPRGFEYVSPASATIVGYMPEELYADPALGRKIVHPDDLPVLDEILRTGQAPQGPLVLRCIHKDGHVVWTEQHNVLVRDETGQVIAVEGIARDITERRKLEQQLQQSQKMEAVGNLAGGVAHDFNNILTVILGYSNFLLPKIKDESLRSDILEIQKAGERASDLTRQLLAFSRRQILQPRVVDLNAVFADIEKLLRRLIGEDIEIVSILDPALARIKVDPGQIEQVTMNLVINARDAMPGGGKLIIETANVSLDEDYARQHDLSIRTGPYVMLAVTDTGHGMGPEVKAHLFEPFFTTKAPGKGTGLGLSTTYGIVRQSGGYIWVYSEPGKGTSFKIYFPRVDEETEEISPAQPPTPPKGTETILLVEDEASVRRVILATLKKAGYRILEAADAAEALDVCQKYKDPVHLMLTDVVMPGLSGRELASRLAESRPAMRVLYMSGYTDHAILEHGILHPGIAFIQKPFSPDGLVRKIREVLHGPEGP